MSKKNNSGLGIKKQVINIAIVVAITALVFTIILGNNKDFSFVEFFDFIKDLNPFYLLGAFLCMLGFIVFEGFSLDIILKNLGYKPKMRQSMIYSASDIYYSAITPSATGGQPASVYYMSKDGIPVSVATATVTFNIFMYTASIMVIAVFALVFNASYFLNFDFIYQVLIVAGIIIQCAILLFFYLLMKKPNILKKLIKWVFTFLHKIKIVKDIDVKLEALEYSMQSYKNCIDMVKGNRKLAIQAFLLNVVQRFSQLAISVFIYYAAGLSGISVIDIFVLQSFCLIGANSIPIPGAAGVSEGLYLSAFAGFFNQKAMLLNCMMATRGISYYICFIFSGIFTFIHHIAITLADKKH